MDKLNVNTIEPEGATTTLNVGISGKSVIITDNLKANTLKDAGGNTIFTSDGSGNLSSVNSGFGSAQVLLSTQTASSSATINFTSGIDSTYKEYVFEFVTIHPATDAATFSFQCSTDGGSNYNTTLTSTVFRAAHEASDDSTYFSYQTDEDQAQGTAYQPMSESGVGSATDENIAGELHLFNPSSTTYVKNYYARTVYHSNGEAAVDFYTAGYFNTTSAINAVSFKFSSGNIDAGTIKMYGIK
jgi:hypothetical protein